MRVQFWCLCVFLELWFVEVTMVTDDDMDYSQFAIDDEDGWHLEPVSLRTAKWIEVKYSIQFPVTDIFPVMYFLSNPGDRHVINQCFFGGDSFEAEALFNSAFVYLQPSYPESGCYQEDQTFYCRGSRKTQTFAPRIWNVAIGYECKYNHPLKLNYSLEVLTRNDTNCEYSQSDVCRKYYNYTSFPNFVSQATQFEAQRMFASSQFLFATECYQHIEEFMCRILFLECREDQVIWPCHQFCTEALGGCQEVLDRYGVPLSCGILPDHPDECVFKRVVCDQPEAPPGGWVRVNGSTLGSVATYDCNEGFRLMGNATRQCAYSGKWTQDVPRCEPIEDNLLKILLITLCVFLFFTGLSISLIVIYWTEVRIIMYVKLGVCRKRSKSSRRSGVTNTSSSRPKDVFLSYHNPHLNFIKEEILPRLESQTPPLRVCLADRDFEIGLPIQDNIENAIRDCRCMVALVCQGFIDSEWCSFEFGQAHGQMIVDPSFRLVVVLMEPIEMLQRVPATLRAYFRTRTYITRQDRIFWARLIHSINQSS